jgi:hypothetical protein
MCLYH